MESAREFFNEVRQAATNLNNAQKRYAYLLDQYSVKTQRYDAQGSISGISDSLQQRYVEAKEKLETTSRDNSGIIAQGVALAAKVTPLLNSNCYEYALLYYYCDAMENWEAVAKMYPCILSLILSHSTKSLSAG